MANTETETLYRIHWRSKTGKTGNGCQRFTKEVAQRLANQENKSWSGLVDHWIEPVSGPTPDPERGEK